MSSSKLDFDSEYIVIGAGASGLACSYYLSRLGYKVTILEASNKVGGLARRWLQNGFWVETGPHIFHSPDEEVTKDWKDVFGHLLQEGMFYAGNIHPDYDGIQFDYPLNIAQLKDLSQSYKEFGRMADEILSLREQGVQKGEGIKSSFREYLNSLVGSTAEEMFFRIYPEKLWGISTDSMLPDWAPKRIRVCDKRESFFEGQFSATAIHGSGQVFEHIEDLCAHNVNILYNTRLTGLIYCENQITEIEVTQSNEEGYHAYKIPLRAGQQIISTMPITYLGSLLDVQSDLKFRGICSTYLYSRKDVKRLLPPGCHFCYYHDPTIAFNRATEPPLMASGLNVSNHISSTYVVLETSYSPDLLSPEVRAELQGKIITDAKRVFGDNVLWDSVCFNFEDYVYPVHDHGSKIALKQISNRLNQLDNLHALGTSGAFHYADMQILFREAKDLVNDLTSQFHSTYALDHKRFNSYRNVEMSKLDLLDTDISRPTIIAEIGINHNRDKELLNMMIDSASVVGCDIIKLQYYKTSDRLSSYARDTRYVEKTQDLERSTRDFLEESELSLDDIVSAFNRIISLEKIPMVTAFSRDAAESLVRIGCTFIKTASMDLNNYSLHSYLSKLGSDFSIFVSTGMSTIDEVINTARIYQHSDCRLTFMHCVSSYPNTRESANLARILALKKILTPFGFSVGYSDHTIGIDAMNEASLYGVSCIEKHFTLDKSLKGPDQVLSATPDEMSRFINGHYHTMTHMLASRIAPLPIEYDTWQTQKKSLYARKDILMGQVITMENTVCLSPPISLCPSVLLKGPPLQARCNIPEGSPITLNSIANDQSL